MSRQGYLVLHEKRQAPKVCFFSLEDGFLRYYATAQSAKSLGEVRLSGCKIVVKAHRRPDSVPNSFFLETRKVNVKDRSYTLSPPVRLELSAHSNEDRQEWGKVLFSWQRYYWRDPRDDEKNGVAAQHSKTKAELDQILAKHYPSNGTSSSCNNNQLEDGAASPSMTTAALSVAKQPLSFLRKNASSLRQSFSMYIPSTTTSSSSTASSSSSVSSTGKGKTDCAGPEVADCEKDKVVLAKVAYAPEQPIYRDDNQDEPIAV